MTHLRAFLGADDPALTRHLTEDGPLAAVLAALGGNLGGTARAALVAELTAATGGLLEEELSAILLAGLMSYRHLIDAGRRTLAQGDLTSLVTLDDHVIRVVHEPHVAVHLDREQVYQLRLTLTVAFTVAGLAATVRAGRLAHVRIGRCTAEVTLSWQDGPLLHRDGLLDEPLVIRLGAGVPIPQACEDRAHIRATARVSPAPSGPW